MFNSYKNLAFVVMGVCAVLSVASVVLTVQHSSHEIRQEATPLIKKILMGEKSEDGMVNLTHDLIVKGTAMQEAIAYVEKAGFEAVSKQQLNKDVVNQVKPGQLVFAQKTYQSVCPLDLYIFIQPDIYKSVKEAEATTTQGKCFR